VRSSSGKIFNNAAQVWNHTFYWNSLSPAGLGAPRAAWRKGSPPPSGPSKSSRSSSRLRRGDLRLGMGVAGEEAFRRARNPQHRQRRTSLSQRRRSGCWTCDVWEHAYYIDYRNDAGAYVKAFWKVANWDFAERNLG